jgi:hypothetical protein
MSSNQANASMGSGDGVQQIPKSSGHISNKTMMLGQ